MNRDDFIFLLNELLGFKAVSNTFYETKFIFESQKNIIDDSLYKKTIIVFTSFPLRLVSP